jgi:ABC-2 type transport system permease protein
VWLKFWPIYRRELKSYVTSPAVAISVAMFFFLSGLFFYGIIGDFSELSSNAQYRKELGLEKINYTRHVVGQLFWSINFLLLFAVPIFTMRLLAEEKKSGTFELLRSLPFTDWNIVTAKFLAAYTLVAAMLLISMYYILLMWRFGQPEMAVVWVAFFGAFVTAAGYVAVGLFASSLTENQIVAAIVGFVALLAFFLVGDVATPGSGGMGRLLEMMSLRYHMEQFTRGLLRAEDVAYFGLLVASFLFLTCRSLELRRWRV